MTNTTDDVIAEIAKDIPYVANAYDFGEDEDDMCREATKYVISAFLEHPVMVGVIEDAFFAGVAYATASHKEFEQTHPNAKTYVEEAIRKLMEAVK